jgi:hypothetical protein
MRKLQALFIAIPVMAIMTGTAGALRARFEAFTGPVTGSGTYR